MSSNRKKSSQGKPQGLIRSGLSVQELKAMTALRMGVTQESVEQPVTVMKLPEGNVRSYETANPQQLVAAGLIAQNGGSNSSKSTGFASSQATAPIASRPLQTRLMSGSEIISPQALSVNELKELTRQRLSKNTIDADTVPFYNNNADSNFRMVNNGFNGGQAPSNDGVEGDDHLSSLLSDYSMINIGNDEQSNWYQQNSGLEQPMYSVNDSDRWQMMQASVAPSMRPKPVVGNDAFQTQLGNKAAMPQQRAVVQGKLLPPMNTYAGQQASQPPQSSTSLLFNQVNSDGSELTQPFNNSSNNGINGMNPSASINRFSPGTLKSTNSLSPGSLSSTSSTPTSISTSNNSSFQSLPTLNQSPPGYASASASGFPTSFTFPSKSPTSSIRKQAVQNAIIYNRDLQGMPEPYNVSGNLAPVQSQRQQPKYPMGLLNNNNTSSFSLQAPRSLSPPRGRTFSDTNNLVFEIAESVLDTPSPTSSSPKLGLGRKSFQFNSQQSDVVRSRTESSELADLTNPKGLMRMNSVDSGLQQQQQHYQNQNGSQPSQRRSFTLAGVSEGSDNTYTLRDYVVKSDGWLSGRTEEEGNVNTSATNTQGGDIIDSNFFLSDDILGSDDCHYSDDLNNPATQLQRLPPWSQVSNTSNTSIFNTNNNNNSGINLNTFGGFNNNNNIGSLNGSMGSSSNNIGLQQQQLQPSLLPQQRGYSRYGDQ